MKKWGIVILVILIMTGLGGYLWYWSCIPREEGICRLNRITNDLGGKYSRISSPYAISERDKPQQLLDIPQLPSDSDPSRYRYFKLSLGQQAVYGLIIVDSKRLSAQLWIDENLNGKLSDESVRYSKRRRNPFDTNHYIFKFGMVQLQNQGVAGSPFGIYCYDNAALVRIWPKYSYIGRIRLDNKIYRMAVIDSDYDTHLSTLFAPSDNIHHINGDTIVLDKDRDNKFNCGNNDNEFEIFPLGRYIQIEKQYYSIAINENTHTVAMQTARPAIGTLSIPANMKLYCGFYSDAASCMVDFSGTIQLPAGRYQDVTSGSLTITDPNETHWCFINNKANAYPDLADFVIEADKTHTVELGPPFVIQNKIIGKPPTVYIESQLVGKSGDTYSLRINKDGRSSEKPEICIFDESGKLLESGTLEYG